MGAWAPGSYSQNLVSPRRGGQGTHPVFLFAQQQDGLGAAFQTWMEAHGAVRAEVLPGSLLVEKERGPGGAAPTAGTKPLS